MRFDRFLLRFSCEYTNEATKNKKHEELDSDSMLTEHNEKPYVARVYVLVKNHTL
jgi:hypothetical protein